MDTMNVRLTSSEFQFLHKSILKRFDEYLKNETKFESHGELKKLQLYGLNGSDENKPSIYTHMKSILDPKNIGVPEEVWANKFKADYLYKRFLDSEKYPNNKVPVMGEHDVYLKVYFAYAHFANIEELQKALKKEDDKTYWWKFRGYTYRNRNEKEKGIYQYELLIKKSDLSNEQCFAKIEYSYIRPTPSYIVDAFDNHMESLKKDGKIKGFGGADIYLATITMSGTGLIYGDYILFIFLGRRNISKKNRLTITAHWDRSGFGRNSILHGILTHVSETGEVIGEEVIFVPTIRNKIDKEIENHIRKYLERKKASIRTRGVYDVYDLEIEE